MNLLNVKDFAFSPFGKDFACIDNDLKFIYFYDEDFDEVEEPLDLSQLLNSNDNYEIILELSGI